MASHVVETNHVFQHAHGFVEGTETIVRRVSIQDSCRLIFKNVKCEILKFFIPVLLEEIIL